MEKILARHLIEIKGTRFLYTKRTKELIIHHLVKGFKYSQFRKTDFIDLEANNDPKKYLKQYEYFQAGKSKKSTSNNDQHHASKDQEAQPLNMEELRRVALVAIRLEDPQINF